VVNTVPWVVPEVVSSMVVKGAPGVIINRVLTFAGFATVDEIEAMALSLLIF
jgi:hypothetical protein